MMNHTVLDATHLLRAQHEAAKRQLLSLAELLHTEGALTMFESGFKAFWEDLYRHFCLEEFALFEKLSAYRSMVLMEVEHNDLFGDLNRVKTALLTKKGVEKAFDALTIRLHGHIKEEDDGIFLLAQKWLEPEEHQWIIRQYALLQSKWEWEESSHLEINRAAPQFKLSPNRLLDAVQKPLCYDTLFETGNASLQDLQIQAGMKTAPHWAGQKQVLTVLSGELCFETYLPNEKTPQETVQLSVGSMVRLDSRLWYSLHALCNSHVLVFRVWPPPHYGKQAASGIMGLD